MPMLVPMNFLIVPRLYKQGGTDFTVYQGSWNHLPLQEVLSDQLVAQPYVVTPLQLQTGGSIPSRFFQPPDLQWAASFFGKGASIQNERWNSRGQAPSFARVARLAVARRPPPARVAGQVADLLWSYSVLGFTRPLLRAALEHALWPGG